MLTKIFAYISLLILTNSGLQAQETEKYQKLTLDDHFSHIIPKDAKDQHPPNFKIKEAAGIILDCSGYDFAMIRKMNEGKNPDLIHILCASGTFIIELNPKGETIIDKTTMRPVGKDPKTFQGFKKGDTPIIGIGTIKVKESKAELMTYWVSMIDVD